MNDLQIDSDARAVAHLVDYLDELKATALAAGALAEIEQRGYITPSEEEQVRRLQISYWQSRNALFELVQSYRHDQPRPADMAPAAFLVAFAAAILLVDATRFLREQFHTVKPIRRKLDSPTRSLACRPTCIRRSRSRSPVRSTPGICITRCNTSTRTSLNYARSLGSLCCSRSSR